MSKLCVINFSGNVGKSTFSRHVLLPRLSEPRYIAVESINADEGSGDNEEALRGRKFRDLMEMVVLSDNVVVDVGASNVEEFIARMGDFEGSHELFDCFIIPTIPKKKQVKDTASTLGALSSLGVSGAKLRLVFNMLTPDTDLVQDFESIFKIRKATPFVYEPVVSLQESDLYPSLQGDSIFDIVNDKTDFKKKMAETPNKEEKIKLLRLQLRQQQATKVKREHDQAFALLFPNEAA
jgi:MinD-like ATPase involved in chromosome partitioning or flagellar assembly